MVYGKWPLKTKHPKFTHILYNIVSLFGFYKVYWRNIQTGKYHLFIKEYIYIYSSCGTLKFSVIDVEYWIEMNASNI